MSIHVALCYLKWSTSPFWSNTVTTSESRKFVTHQKYSRLKLSYRFLARIEEIFIVFWGVDSRFRTYLVEGTATGLLGFIQFVLARFGCISTSLLCLITLLSWYISSFIGLVLVSSSSLADLVLSDSCNLVWHPFSVQVVDYTNPQTNQRQFIKTDCSELQAWYSQPYILQDWSQKEHQVNNLEWDYGQLSLVCGACTSLSTSPSETSHSDICDSTSGHLISLLIHLPEFKRHGSLNCISSGGFYSYWTVKPLIYSRNLSRQRMKY
jgi:hypothetical protein